jgi:eukaryotic-like serine/threonine-protein kinase
MNDDDLESRVLRFERAWRLRGPCEVADHLDGPPAMAASGRFRLLVELICIDLEYRWRSTGVAEPATLESYVGRFPELGGLDRLPIELIGEEYRARRRWGDRPSHAEFLSRFRQRRDLIRAELLRVDDEMAAESALPPLVPKSTTRPPSPIGP